ncbi:hypothetical protein LJB76_02780 [Clostridia bacterium OttesenSCG-928-O13]|nr:hypothetical protein [Clostridia bacterium OttesenSCG-928-O13]
MKANVRKTTADTLAVRGVALSFNSLHERDIRREGETEKLIEEKYPGALDILNMKVELGDVKDGVELANLYESVTKGCCEFFDTLFGEGTSAKLLGDDPYCGQAIQLFTEFKTEIMKQGLDFGQNVGKTLTQYEPVGPAGEKPAVKPA